MFIKSSLLLALGGSALVAAVPTAQSSQPSAESPCAQIAESKQQSKIPGKLALQCLQSMPFDSKRGVAFINDLRKYMQWQSNVDVLPNPPTSYQGIPADIFGGLQNIQGQAEKNKYANQFEFDTAIKDVIYAAQDGHLAFKPCSDLPFVFVGTETLVSVSPDGLELPEIYTFNDAKVLETNPDAVSPVVTINNETAASHVETVARAENQPYQDPDARYNSIFHSFFRVTSQNEALGGFSFSLTGAYPGTTEYVLEYANGTTSTANVNAVSQKKFVYKTGQEVFDNFCVPQPATSSAAPSSSATPAPSSTSSVATTSAATTSAAASQTPSASVVPAPSAYPKAAVRDENNLFAGYLLDKPALEDVAVLSVPTFSISGVEGGNRNISSLVVKFIQQAKDAGKKKAIIDLSSNPGGDTNYLFDLFSLFFPNRTPYWSTRMRAQEGLFLLEKMGYALPQDPEDETWASLADTGYFGLVTPNQTYTYGSLEELYGPHEVLGANMTSPNAYSLDYFSTEDSPIHGYGPVKANWTEPPFAPEDILLITDGMCASSCPIFTQLMEYEGVKTVTFGGRPRYGPMQSMGGTRGAHVLKGTQLVEILANSARIAGKRNLLSKEEIKTLESLTPAETSPLKFGAITLNIRDAYSKHDKESLMPLQFTYQTASCRLFYTLENILSPASAWVSAAKAVWGDADCVAGSRS
ncbi:hypothetical protein BDW62DRAFT_220163 [Aspergillus aurantiobrunneus]